MQPLSALDGEFAPSGGGAGEHQKVGVGNQSWAQLSASARGHIEKSLWESCFIEDLGEQ